MSEVTRYNFVRYDDAPHDSGMEVDPDGEYIRYDDLKAILDSYGSTLRERAAKIAESKESDIGFDDFYDGFNIACGSIADAIRSMSLTPEKQP